MNVSIATRTQQFSGEMLNGDAVVSREVSVNGGELYSLLAVIDGLGHGPKANEASAAAVDCLRQVDITLSADSIMGQVHNALLGTRGAAGTIALVGAGRVRACGVGNVELRTAGATVPFRLTPGVIGKKMRRLYVAEAALQPMRLALFSDGVSARFYLDDYATRSLDTACDEIFRKHQRASDDASLLLADIQP